MPRTSHHRRPMGGRGSRRNSGGRPASAPPSPAAIGNGVTVWLRGAGITQALGSVASIDSEGSNTVRFAADSEIERPDAETVGSLVVAAFDGNLTAANASFLDSLSTLAIVRPYTIGIVLAPTFVGLHKSVFDLDPTGGRCHLRSHAGAPNKLTWTDNLQAMDTATALSDGVYYSLILRSQVGTSSLLLNGVQEDTAVVGSNAAPASTWRFGKTASDLNSAGFRLADFAIFNGEYLTDPEVLQLDAWHSYVKGLL